MIQLDNDFATSWSKVVICFNSSEEAFERFLTFWDEHPSIGVWLPTNFCDAIHNHLCGYEFLAFNHIKAKTHIMWIKDPTQAMLFKLSMADILTTESPLIGKR